MSHPQRVVICDEPRRCEDLAPGQPELPSAFFDSLAGRLEIALKLPVIVVGIALEQCERDDFVFYSGSWGAFVAATPTWNDEERRQRAHRTGHLRGTRDRAYGDRLERSGMALSVPSRDIGGPISGGPAELYALRDVAQAIGLRLFEAPQLATEHYVTALSPPGMSQEDMIARYLRAYWATHGY